jgi:hypothetical protein
MMSWKLSSLLNPFGVVVGAAALTLVLLSWLPDEAQEQPLQLYSGIPIDASLLALDKKALDEAYHQQLLLLFSVWMRQQAGETEKLQNGLRLARRAYNLAAQQIAKREQQLLELDRQQQEHPQ